MTLVEVLIAIGLLTLVFGGILAAFQVITQLIGSSKAQAGAVSLANEKMEYIRSLPYNDVGTISGIPNGPIPQTASTSLNGIAYQIRVLIEYIDDPADGTGASDLNSILADYKLVKVTYSWDANGVSKEVSLLSNIVPRGIETTVGGGTLAVNVFDATVTPVSGAAVRVYNNTGTTTIDTTRYTNIDGIALFSGAPALGGYEITVTDTGYSTDQTYSASTTNPNPVTSHVAVLESQISTMNFQIDRVSSLEVVTLGIPTTDTFEDPFDDMSNTGSSTDTTVSFGALKLEETAGVYVGSGTVFSSTITPVSLASWDTLYVEAIAPTDTTLRVQVYDSTGTTTRTLVSDTALPGNALGFVGGSVNLTSLDTSVYQSLVLGATLTSANTATTSELLLWRITYTESQSPIASVPFTLTSLKSIGTDVSLQPIAKYQKSHTTDGTGDITISNLEWGIYDVAVADASYTIAEACKNIPYSLQPNVNETLTLILAPSVARSLRVIVQDSAGGEVSNAEVTLSQGGFTAVADTSSCGQVFFNSGVPSAIDFSLTVDAFGFVTQTITDIEITSSEELVVTLVDL